MRAVVKAVVEGLPQHRVLVVDAPRGLQHRVEETVAGRPVPQSVEPAVQPRPQLQGPVDDGRLLFKFYTGGVKSLYNAPKRVTSKRTCCAK